MDLKKLKLGSVYRRRGSQALVFDWYDETGKRRTKRVPADEAKTKEQARRYARAWLREQIDQHARPESDGSVTLGNYLDGWLERREINPNVRESTRRTNRTQVARLKRPAGERLLADLRIHCREVVVQLRDEPRSPDDARPLGASAVRNHHSTLKTVLDSAVEEQLIPSNPARATMVVAELPERETRAQRDHVVVHLRKAEAEMLLTCQAVPEDRRVRHLVGLHGIDEGPVAALCWRDVLLDDDVPHIDIYRKFTGKGGFGPPKTKNRVRKVPLHPVALRALRAWKKGGVGRARRPTCPTGGPSISQREERALPAAGRREPPRRSSGRRVP